MCALHLERQDDISVFSVAYYKNLNCQLCSMYLKLVSTYLCLNIEGIENKL